MCLHVILLVLFLIIIQCSGVPRDIILFERFLRDGVSEQFVSKLLFSFVVEITNKTCLQNLLS